MWEPSQTALPELAQYLSVPAPGLSLLRYRSVYAFDGMLGGLHPGDRQVHRVSYRPRAHDERASPTSLVQRCRALAGSTIPIIFLCPDPDIEAASDLGAQALFWKQMNANREALGAIPAQIIVTLDEAQTASCFHHAKDLVSWCSPKFELTAITPLDTDANQVRMTAEKTSDQDTTSTTVSSALTWDSLYPFLEAAVQSGPPLSSRAVSRLLFPLMRHALDSGAITQAVLLLPIGDRAAFSDERERSSWLELKGDLAVAQGDTAEAWHNFTEASLITERLAASDPANAAWRRNHSVSLLRLGDLAAAQGDLVRSLRYVTEAKLIAERLAASDPANTMWQRDLSVSLNKLGDLQAAHGDLPLALRSFTEAKVIAERLARIDPADAERQRDLSVSLSKLGDLALAQGDLAGALRYFTGSATIRERLAASDPANAAWQRDLCVALSKLGDIAMTQGDPVGALRYFTKARVIAERLATTDPANATWQRDLALTLNRLGDLSASQGDLLTAIGTFREAKIIVERLAATDPANAEWQRDAAISHLKAYQIAAKTGDEATQQAELLACFTVLDGMKNRGLELDSQMATLYDQLQPFFTQS